MTSQSFCRLLFFVNSAFSLFFAFSLFLHSCFLVLLEFIKRHFFAQFSIKSSNLNNDK